MKINILCQKKDQATGLEHRQIILDLLEKAPQRIRILCLNIDEVNLVDDKELSKILLKALAANVTLSIVIGTKPGNLKQDTINFLKTIKDHGGYIYFNKRVHAKLFFAEDNLSSNALITSANFTKTGLYKNYELGSCYHKLNDGFYNEIKEFTNYILSLDATRPFEYYF